MSKEMKDTADLFAAEGEEARERVYEASTLTASNEFREERSDDRALGARAEARHHPGPEQESPRRGERRDERSPGVKARAYIITLLRPMRSPKTPAESAPKR